MNSRKLLQIESKKSTIYDCCVIELPKIHNRAGNITPIDAGINLPFEIARVYYLYDIPGGETRDGHAHKELQQLVIAASGSFDVLPDDGTNKKAITLNQSYYGLYIIPGIWREILDFSSGAICLVLASHKYDEKDYIRNYEEFSILQVNFLFFCKENFDFSMLKSIMNIEYRTRNNEC